MEYFGIQTLQGRWAAHHLSTAGKALEQKREQHLSQRKFLVDLTDDILQWQEEGNNIILMIDINEDILAPRITKFCNESNLEEAIANLQAHPQHQHTKKEVR